MTMECRRMQDAIEDYAAGRLPADEAAALEAHLAGCAACGRELRWVSALKSGVRSGPRPALPPELRASLMRMAREASSSRGAESLPWFAALRLSWRAAAGLGFATACAAALLVLGRPGADGEELSLDEALAAHSRYELTMPAAGREAVYADLGLRLSREGGRHD
jgi:anti-sigma factor RsiW